MKESYVLSTVVTSQQAEWERFIETHPQGHLLQSWNWGELKTGPNWRPLRMVLRVAGTGEILAAAQVLQRTAGPIPARLAHLAYVPKGPVVDWTLKDEAGESVARMFISGLRSYMRRKGALALQLEPPLEIGTAQAEAARLCLQDLGFREVQAIQPARTIMLDLQPSEEELLARMKEKWRYNVRLAARKGVEVHVAERLDELQAWYGLLQTTGERDHFGIHTLAYYRRAWEILGSRQQARLLLAYAGSELLAGIFVSCVGKEAIYLYGASSNQQRNLMPNYLLQWEAIRWARTAGASTYDFWGIPISDESDEAMAGVYRFKSGWGGRIVSFAGNYEYVYRPLAMHMANKFVKRD